MGLTAEQHAIRARGIGSSDIAAVAGLNPWRKPIDVWLDKTGRAEKSEESPAQTAGNRLEPVIASWYTEERRVALVGPCGTIVGNNAWEIATPDYRRDDTEHLVEIKLVGARVAHHWSDGLPDYVLAQVLWQQRVTGYHSADVAALIGGTEFAVIPCPYLPEVADDLGEIAREFWHENVLKDVPPAIDASDSWARYLAKRWPQEGGPIVPATGNAQSVGKRLALAIAKRKLAEEEEAEAENQMKALIGENAGIGAREWTATWKHQEPVDVKAHTRKATRRFNFTTREG